MIRTLSAATRASLRRIVENSGSSAYAKSSVFSSGFLGHILRIILRLAIVRGNLVVPRIREFSAERIVPTPLPRDPRAPISTGIYDRPQVGLSVKQIIGLIDDQGRVFAINRTVYARTGRFDADKRFRHRNRKREGRCSAESGSTEIAARIGECVAPSCAHAVIVHSAVASNDTERGGKFPTGYSAI